MIESFELPKDLLARLPVLCAFLRDRDKILAGGFSYEQLLEEMDAAIAAIDLPSPPDLTPWCGRCWVHPEATINEHVVMEGPCIVCKGAVVGPKAYLGPGTVVGPYVKLAFGVQVKATVIGTKSTITHRTFVANSVIGESAAITETVVVSSKRRDLSPVKSWTLEGQPLQTNLTHLGAHIGTQTKVGARALLMPGSVLCDNVSVGNTVVTGYVKSHKEPQQFDSRVDIVKILIERLHRQLDLFWRRNHMFLTITGILFAAAVIIIEAGDGSDISALLCLCIFGLIVSLGWVQVGLIGKAECDRVAEDLKETLEKDVEMRRCFKTWFEDRQGSGLRDSGTMVALQIIAVLSAALWLGIGIWWGGDMKKDAPADPVLGESESIPAPPEPPAAVETQTAGMPPSSPPLLESESAEGLQPPVTEAKSIELESFTVQVAALQKRAKADALRAMLQGYGYPVYLTKANIPGLGHYYRVRIGPFRTAEEAAQVESHISQRFAGHLSRLWIVPYEGDAESIERSIE